MSAETEGGAAERRSAEMAPIWLRRAAALSWRILAIVALAALAIWVAGVLSTVTASIIVAVVVAVTFEPLMQRLLARGWSGAKASAAVTLIAAIVAVALIAVVTLAFVPYLRDLTAGLRDASARIGSWLDGASVSSSVSRAIEGAIANVHNWIVGGVGALVGSVASVVTVGILALFLLFFLLSDGEKAWLWAREAVPERHRDVLYKRGRRALAGVGAYVRGTAAIGALRGLAYLGILLVLGVPFALPLAVVLAIGAFVPYLGGLVTVAAVLLVAVAALDALPMLVLVVFVIAEWWVEARVLRPAALSEAIGLPPALVLLALPIGAYLAGFVGVLAAIPVAAFGVAIGGTIIDLLRPADDAQMTTEVAGWIDRLAQWSWRALAILAVLGVAVLLISLTPLLVVPLLVAIVLAATVAPVAGFLERRGWSHPTAALTVTGGAFALILTIVVIAFAYLAGPLVEAVRSAIAGAEAAGEATGGSLGWLEPLAQTVGGNVLEAARTALLATGSLALVLVLAPLLAFYFLKDAPRGWAVITARAAPWRRPALEAGGERAAEILGGYMLGTAAISAVGAISQFLIMAILGLPLAVPIAILSFIACFIPYVGGFVTTGLAFLVALAFGSPTEIAIMFVYTIVFNIVQGNIVTPLVYTRTVSLHPAVVLLAIPAGGALAGIAGMFLAVPILAVIAATWRSALLVLGDEPSLPPPPQPESALDSAAVLAPAPAEP
ncbi:MAG TPA: AI-2E family transporter [Candidatus Limnocylindria bacterium]|nr:AI-2E family transporter [Candidatus Limnocylindria bacterium]